MDPILKLGREYQIEMDEERIFLTLLFPREASKKYKQFRLIQGTKGFWYHDLICQPKNIQVRILEDTWLELKRTQHRTSSYRAVYKLTTIRKIDKAITRIDTNSYEKEFLFSERG